MQIIDILINDFLEDKKLLNYSNSTLINYGDSLNLFNKYLSSCGVSDIRTVDLAVLNEYRSYILEKYSNLNTAHLRLRAVKQLFDYLAKVNQLLLNPFQRFIMPKLGDRLPRNILTKEEMLKLLDAPNVSSYQGIRDRAIIETLYSTGLRLSECINLKVADLDCEGGHLRVNKGKGAKDRILPLGSVACKWLKEYLGKVRPHYLREVIKRGSRRIERNIDKDNRYLWVGENGNFLKAIWLNKLLNNYSKKAGINKKLTVHTIRRTFATHILQEGANPFYVQQLLGHSNAKTMGKYIKLVPTDLKQAHKKHHPREKDRR